MKSKHYLFILAVLSIGFCLLAAGCTQPQGATQTTVTTTAKFPTTVPPTARPPSQEQSSYGIFDYFPMDIGNEWSYKITTGNVKPMYYEEVTMIGGEEVKYFAARGQLGLPTNGQYDFRIRIKGKPSSNRPETVVLDLVTDQGILLYAREVQWGLFDITPIYANFRVTQKISQAVIFDIANPKIFEPRQVYPVLKTGRPDSLSSERIIFILGDPGEGIQKEGSPEMVKVASVDKNLAGYQGIPCIHILREVARGINPQDRAFTEDSWYAPDKGLVRLEQKIDGQVSMTWTLESFKES